MSPHPAVRTRFETPTGHSWFYGYYDTCPVDAQGHRLLAHRTDVDGRDVHPDDTADVGWFDLESGTWHAVGTTHAFNWQQGAMLQWLPPDFSRRLVYNDRREGRFVAVIHDGATGRETVLPCPVYAVHPSGTWALAANVERLAYCRPGYCYAGVDELRWDRPVHPEDGIFRVDFETGAVALVVRTQELAGKTSTEDMAGRNHWLEHMMWNPAGTRFAFYHRWNDDAGGHTTRLYTAAADGSDRFMFPDTGFYSHMNWRDDEDFVVWARALTPAVRSYLAGRRGHAPLVRACLPLYRWCRDHVMGGKALARSLSGQACLRMRDREGPVGSIAAVTEDGHMSFRPGDSDTMLIDTYEDDARQRHLHCVSLARNSSVRLASFPSCYNRTGFRCDLHPRWDRSGTRVIIDVCDRSPHRRMVMLEVNPGELWH